MGTFCTILGNDLSPQHCGVAGARNLRSCNSSSTMDLLCDEGKSL